MEYVRKVYEFGLKYCFNCILLWILYVNFEERVNDLNKVRNILIIVRKKNFYVVDLWLVVV